MIATFGVCFLVLAVCLLVITFPVVVFLKGIVMVQRSEFWRLLRTDEVKGRDVMRVIVKYLLDAGGTCLYVFGLAFMD